jgi:hypothetical protein
MDKMELLAQGTCAIVRPATDSTPQETVGTAWLAMAPRYLLTAGHVVAGDSVVTVQFSDEDSRLATVLFEPMIIDDLGVDVAVLELQDDTDRQPLPIVLIDRPQGDVIVTGYGLANAQSTGFGSYLRPYIRAHRSENFLLQFTSRNLAIQGFSGAPVYSLTSNAVIGLQIEASPKTDQVLAMPLSRIPRYWTDIQSVAAPLNRGLCVFLQQPHTSKALIQDVIVPAVDSIGLELYRSAIGGTTKQDLAKIDRADVIVAEVDADDPSVTRELTIAQGLGTPDLLVRVRDGTPHADADPDGPVDVDLAEPAAARAALVQRLISTLAVFNAVGDLVATNPITRFFGVPLTRVSAANALAIGYFANFVSPVGELLLDAHAGRQITITVDGVPLDLSRYSHIRLQVVLPERLRWATDRGIRRRVDHLGLLADATIAAPELLSRARSLKALRESVEPPELVLVDIFPTTMSTMITSIDERFESLDPADRDPHLWETIERKEIDRFDRALSRRIREVPPGLRDLALADIVHVTTARLTFPGVAFEE